MLLPLLLLTVPGMSALTTMKLAFSWTNVDYTFESETERQRHLETGLFIPRNNLMNDVDVWRGNGSQTVFVCLAKFKSGIPVTLATVTNQTRNGVTLLQPYPDWSWQAKCEYLYSTYRMKVDKCDRLWVLDSGVYEDTKLICPPKIVIFDLKTNKAVRRHQFPDQMVSCNSNLITIIVDVREGDCMDATAYIADVGAFKMFVYDLAKDSSWVITNAFFYPNPFYGHFKTNGTELLFMDGLFGIALGPEDYDKDRTLYFHSLSGVNVFWVKTSLIRNQSLFVNDSGACRDCFTALEGTRLSQSSAQDMTEDGLLFSAMVAENSIEYWDSKLAFKKENICTVAKDDEKMQFISGLKVVDGEVWVLSNRLQNYVNDKQSMNEVNYHILHESVANLVKNKLCD